MKTFKGTIQEVHSGDDLVVLVDLGIDGLFKKTRVRLRGVDTPDGYKAKPQSDAGRIRDEIRAYVGRPAILEEVDEGKGGWVAVVSVVMGEDTSLNLNEYLRGKGYIYATSPAKRKAPEYGC